MLDNPKPHSPLRPAQFFHTDENIVIEPDHSLEFDASQTDDIHTIDFPLTPKTSLAKRLFILVFTLFIIASIVQTGYHIYAQWVAKAWLSMLIDLCLLGLGLALVSFITKELYTLKRLKNRLNLQAQGHALFHSNRVDDEAKTFCLGIVKSNGLGAQDNDTLAPSVKHWLSQINETHTHQEIMTLFEQSVMISLDKRAMKVIETHMTDSAILVALSPLALVDMLFVAWRNLRMVNQIAAIYGLELNYLSRIRLLKLVLFNVAFVGGAELITELGSEFVSQDLVGKFSTRAAQGIGAGVLTARLGLHTLKLCRPIPFSQSAPKLSQLRLSLINRVKDMMKSAG